MRPGHVVGFGHTSFFLFSLLASVSAWPRWLPDIDALVVRAASATGSSVNASATPTSQSLSATTQLPSQANLNTAAAPSKVPSGFASGSGQSQAPSTATTIFPAEDPAGSVVMVTPAPALGAQLYKAGSWVTFGWSYTNIQAPPPAVDVLLSYSASSLTWTLTSNMTFATSAAFLWDSAPQASDVQQPIKPGVYTLVILESDSKITAAPEPGYLAAAPAMTFGLFTPQPYTPLADWSCPTCNSAFAVGRHALGFAVAMSVISVFTFNWFVTGITSAF